MQLYKIIHDNEEIYNSLIMFYFTYRPTIKLIKIILIQLWYKIAQLNFK